jgi:hypothetical protein
MYNRKFHIRAAVDLSDFTLLMQRYANSTDQNQNHQSNLKSEAGKQERTIDSLHRMPLFSFFLLFSPWLSGVQPQHKSTHKDQHRLVFLIPQSITMQEVPAWMKGLKDKHRIDGETTKKTNGEE